MGSDLKIFNQQDDAKRGMNRREMVRQILGAAGLGYAAPALAASHPIHKHLMNAARMSEADAMTSEPNWKPLFLDSHQSETLGVLAERIVPGSNQANVNRFIDLLLSVDTKENQQKFLNALSAFESQALSRYGRPFLGLTGEEQDEILTAASTPAPGTGHEPEMPFRRRGPRHASTEANQRAKPATFFDHFQNLKMWVVGAYYSSEVGMKDLGWTGQVIFASFPGCQDTEGHH
jgi:hypothetical protein